MMHGGWITIREKSSRGNTIWNNPYIVWVPPRLRDASDQLRVGTHVTFSKDGDHIYHGYVTVDSEDALDEVLQEYFDNEHILRRTCLVSIGDGE